MPFSGSTETTKLNKYELGTVYSSKRGLPAQGDNDRCFDFRFHSPMGKGQSVVVQHCSPNSSRAIPSFILFSVASQSLLLSLLAQWHNLLRRCLPLICLHAPSLAKVQHDIHFKLPENSLRRPIHSMILKQPCPRKTHDPSLPPHPKAPYGPKWMKTCPKRIRAWPCLDAIPFPFHCQAKDHRLHDASQCYVSTGSRHTGSSLP